MCVQFGRWNFDGRPVAPDYAAKLTTLLEPYASDSVTVCTSGSLLMAYAGLGTIEGSSVGRQPLVCPSGIVLTWDGRLDNRGDLRQTSKVCGPNPCDVRIVAAHWEQHGAYCLGELLGDWALSVFNPDERTLVLAKDFLGTRPLYYLRCDRYVAWSTVLHPLILLSDERFTLSEQYIAEWLAGFPQAHLTPYEEIRAVPPSCFVTITSHSARIEEYWDFQAYDRLKRKSDAEYEEQFRLLFCEAVRRRLRCNSPVLAELSGGMDSSAVVCIADRVQREEGGRQAETVSFFDDNDPNWNERPFFTAVEKQRGHTGFHLEVGDDGRFIPERSGTLPVTPVHAARPSKVQEKFAQYLADRGFRVLLSGLGGDEFTGGVLTGTPELADLLSTGKFREFLYRAFLWAVATRNPLLHVVGRVLRCFLPAIWVSRQQPQWPMPWLASRFVRRNQQALRSNRAYFHYFGALPSFQENLRALDGLRRQIACAELPPSAVCEKRYPFLDRNLLEFLFNIPREQLVRPQQRRSLLRRALRGIVPDLVLDRPRKAYAGTSFLKAIGSDWDRIVPLTENMSLESYRAVDSTILFEELEKARRGSEVALVPLMRVLRLEWWMRDPRVQRLFKLSQLVRSDDLFLKRQVARCT